MSKPLTSEQLASIAYQLEHAHESRGGWEVVINIVCLVLSTIAIILRFVSRRVAGLRYEADDYTILAGWVSP